MPSVRIRRNTYAVLPTDGIGRPGVAAQPPSGQTNTVPLGLPVGSSEDNTASAPDNAESRPQRDAELELSSEAESSTYPLQDMSSSDNPSTTPATRPRAHTSAAPERGHGRSRSKTIQACMGNRYQGMEPMNFAVVKSMPEGGNSAQGGYVGGNHLTTILSGTELNDEPAEASNTSPTSARASSPPHPTYPTANAQPRTRRSTLMGRARGETISAGGSPVGLAFPDSPNRHRRSSNAGDDVEARIGLPTGRGRSVSVSLGNALRRSSMPKPSLVDTDEHLDEVVEHLDVIDPEVATVGSLQNCANSIMVPHIPQLWNRKPVLTLPDTPSETSLADEAPDTTDPRGRRSSTSSTRPPLSTTSSTESLTPHEKAEEALDKHVEHVLRKRDKVKRTLKGLWAFVKTPIGFITAVYGFLVAFWGAAIVLFLLGWIDTGSSYNKSLWVEISSQIENGLFTITGVGFIPWRVTDAYRIFIIWRLKRISVKLRKKRGLAPIECPDDLPDPEVDPDFVPVLTEKQQAQLQHQQTKFMASQTWYRPHATETHRAFPISWALWICLDGAQFVVGNSFFQVILCCCMWSMNRFQRPAWTTGSLIPLSFLCGIAAAVLIWKGGEKTKKKKQVEAKLREALGVDADAPEMEYRHDLSPSQQSDTGNGNDRTDKQDRTEDVKTQ